MTIGALLGMAAHLEGKGCTVLDMTGLAQKGGAVTAPRAHRRQPEEIHAVRIAAGERRPRARLRHGRRRRRRRRSRRCEQGVTTAVVNSARGMPAARSRTNPTCEFRAESMEQSIRDAAGDEAAEFVDATELATALMGDSIATNLFMVGYAWQKGLLPLSSRPSMRAIELNGAAVEINKQSLRLGPPRRRRSRRRRRRAADAGELRRPRAALSRALDEMIARRGEFLTDYQDAAYAARYSDFVDKVAQRREGEARRAGASSTEAVARYFFKLIANKDEYEVARLYTETDFLKQLGAQFEGDYKLRFHLAPPLFAERDPATGEPKKRDYGAWMLPASACSRS